MNSLEPISDDELERAVRAHYRRDEAPISSFEDSWAALESALNAPPADVQASMGPDVLPASIVTASDAPASASTGRVDGMGRGLRRSRRLAAVIGPLAAVLLIALLAGLIFGSLARRGEGSGPTLTNHLTWQDVRYPDNVSPNYPQSSLQISRYNGNIAYLCATRTLDGSLPAPRLWVTHDRGATWTRLADLPDITSATGCTLTVDAFEPDIVAATLSQTPDGNTPSTRQATAFISIDGGQRWRLAPKDPEGFVIYGLATWQGHTFAQRSSTENQPGDLQERLFVSDDHLQTWRPVDTALFAALPPVAHPGQGQGANRLINQFWLHPATGELLVETDMGTLWISSDLGRHWTQRLVPLSALGPEPTPTIPADPDLRAESATTVDGQFIVQPPTAGQPFHICGDLELHDANGIIHGQIMAYACSWDGGMSWITRPPLTFAPLCPQCQQLSPPGQNVHVYAILPDGSLLGVASPEGIEGKSAFCRFPRGATQSSQWEYLGLIQGATAGGYGFLLAFDQRGVIIWNMSNSSTSVTSYP